MLCWCSAISTGGAAMAAIPTIVGKTFQMNNRPHTVVGVLPPIPQYPNEQDVYMPTANCPARASEQFKANRNSRMMSVFGRLKPDVPVAQAQADLSTLASNLQNQYPESYPANRGYAASVVSLQDELTRRAKADFLDIAGNSGAGAADRLRQRCKSHSRALDAPRTRDGDSRRDGRWTRPPNRYALLVAAAPLIWMAWDLIVTGEPLYSLTSTREVSGQFGRNRGLFEAITLIPQYSGGNDRIVTVGVGGMGLILAVWILRRRAALPLALGGLGVLTFLIIAAAGLSVIPRYMQIPSLLLSLCVAVALGGWTLVKERTPRRIAIGVAVVSVLVIGWRATYYVQDFQKLADQARFVEAQHKGLKDVLDAPRAVEVLQNCAPITTPTHSAIPVIRYETGLPKEALEASIAQKRPPTAGVLLIGKTFNFEPSAARATNSNPSSSARRRWSNKPLPGFERRGRSATWTVYARCP